MEIKTRYSLDERVYFIHGNRLQRGFIKFISASAGNKATLTLYGVEFLDTTEEMKLKEVHINENLIFSDTGKLYTFLEEDFRKNHSIQGSL